MKFPRPLRLKTLVPPGELPFFPRLIFERSLRSGVPAVSHELKFCHYNFALFLSLFSRRPTMSPCWWWCCRQRHTLSIHHERCIHTYLLKWLLPVVIIHISIKTQEWVKRLLLICNLILIRSVYHVMIHLSYEEPWGTCIPRLHYLPSILYSSHIKGVSLPCCSLSYNTRLTYQEPHTRTC